MLETFSPGIPEHSNQPQKAIDVIEQNHRKSTWPKQSKESRTKPLDSVSIEILKLVRDARYVTSDDLGAIIPMKQNSLQVKLKTLTRQDFLARPAAQKYLDHERGRPPLVYALARNGARLLEVPYEEPDRRFRFLEHALMTSRIYLTFVAGALKNGADVQLWEREPEDMPALYIPHMKATCVNRPDALLEYRTDRQDRFFIEAETGQVPVVRKNPRQSSIARKVMYYSALQKVAQYPPFRVLFFLPSDVAYFEACREVCRAIDPVKKGLNCFWFCFYENVRVSDPDAILTEPYWFTPSSGKSARPLIISKPLSQHTGEMS